MSEVVSNESGKFLPLDYEGVVLPEFSDEQEKIRSLDLRFEDLLGALKVEKEKGLSSYLTLLDKKSSYALHFIDELVAKFVLVKVEEVAESPDSLERAKNAVIARDWTGITDGSSEQFTLTELIVKANRLKFGLIQDWMENAKETALTPVAQLEFEHIMPAMAANDRMFLKMEREMLTANFEPTEIRARFGFNNETAVIKEKSGDPPYHEVFFHEAYPEETETIAACYESLLDGLGKMKTVYAEDANMLDLIDRKEKYYSAVLKATRSSDMADWSKADALLPQQVRNSMDPAVVHAIELGYLRDAKVRAPEIGIRTPDLSEGKTLDLTLATKDRMVASFSGDTLFDDCPAVKASLPLLKNSGGRADHFLGSGLEHRILPAGQLLPNDFEPRTKGGIVAFFNVAKTRENNLPRLKAAFEKIFGAEEYERLCAPVISAEIQTGLENAGHEMGHALGLVNDVKDRLGVELLNTYAEEWKATVAGARGNFYLPSQKEQPAQAYEMLKGWLVRHIIIACRYAGARGNSYGQPYFRKSMMLMKVAQDVGILEQNSQSGEQYPWKINLDSEKATKFFETISGQLHDLMKIYGPGGSQDDLEAFFKQHLVTTPFIEHVCANFPIMKEASSEAGSDALPELNPAASPVELAKVPSQKRTQPLPGDGMAKQIAAVIDAG